MKNMFKKFSIIFIALLIVLSTGCISHAENDSINDSTEKILDSIYQPDSIPPLPEGIIPSTAEDTFKTYENPLISAKNTSGKNFFEASANDVNINNSVTGDVYVLSGGTVTINTYISGNVFICARKVVIGKDTKIMSSLFNASQSIKIDGNILGNVYVVSQDFDLTEFSSLGLDLSLAAENIKVNGIISRDASITGADINISNSAQINGDLNYSTSKEITIPDNVVKGSTIYNKISTEEKQENNKNDIIYSCLSFVILAIVLFLIFKWLNNRVIYEHQNFTKNFVKYILFGFLGLLITPIICLIIALFGFTINIALLLFAIYFMIIMISSATLVIILSNLCANKFKDQFKINDTLKNVIFIAILGLVYKLVQLIPVFGGILTFVATLIGIGILIKCIIPEKQSKN